MDVSHDEGESADAGDAPPLDLTPRTTPSRRRRGLAASLVLVAVVAALALIAVKALGDASLFFLNAFAPDVGWRLAFLMGPVLALVVIVVARTLPESPRWLMTHGRSAPR